MAVPTSNPLPPKQLSFVAEYLKDNNATQAAIRAGYSEKTAESQGARLLGYARVRAEIERRQTRIIEQVDIQAADVLRELARIAGSDIRMLFDEHGNVRPVKEWPDEFAACVASVEVILKNAKAGDGIVDQVMKVRLWDKVKALEMLARHKALFPKEAPEVNVNVVVVNQSTDTLLARAQELVEKGKGLQLVKAS